MFSQLRHVFLVRHGESEHNLKKQVFMGRSPSSALTPKGVQQAQALAHCFNSNNVASTQPTVAICSSLMRCQQTATIVASALDIPLHQEDKFWEMSKGQWEGRMSRPPPEPWLSQLSQEPFNFCYPAGESHQILQERILPAFKNWLKRFPKQNLLFVLHGDVILNLLQYLMEFHPQRINDFNLILCSITHLIQTPTSWILNSFNHSKFQNET